MANLLGWDVADNKIQKIVIYGLGVGTPYAAAALSRKFTNYLGDSVLQRLQIRAPQFMPGAQIAGGIELDSYTRIASALEKMEARLANLESAYQQKKGG